jgi:S1-C subfamily serine protease
LKGSRFVLIGAACVVSLPSAFAQQVPQVADNRAFPTVSEAQVRQVSQAVRVAGRAWPGGPALVRAADLGFTVEQTPAGLVVSSVAERGVVAGVGLMAGDRIVGINDTLVRSEAQLVRL